MAPAPLLGASIRVVASRTGIPADTLRMWERRYGFPKPARRDGGSRVYSENDVARLKLIGRAIAAGFRPSETVPLSERALTQLLTATVADVAASSGTREPRRAPDDRGRTGDLGDVSSVIDALLADDVQRVTSLLRSSAIALGPRAFVTDLAHPLTIRVGELWAEGRLAVRHEHLASACLRAQLVVLLAALEDGPRSPSVLLAGLPGEQHVLALDMIAVYLAVVRAAPRILGAETPPDQVVAAAAALRADVVGLTVSAVNVNRATKQAVSAIAEALPRSTQLWIGGAGGPSIASATPRARMITSFSDLDRAVASISER